MYISLIPSQISQHLPACSVRPRVPCPSFSLLVVIYLGEYGEIVNGVFNWEHLESVGEV